jgi:hypothetical protein
MHKLFLGIFAGLALLAGGLTAAADADQSRPDNPGQFQDGDDDGGGPCADQDQQKKKKGVKGTKKKGKGPAKGRKGFKGKGTPKKKKGGGDEVVSVPVPSVSSVALSRELACVPATRGTFAAQAIPLRSPFASVAASRRSQPLLL